MVHAGESRQLVGHVAQVAAQRLVERAPGAVGLAMVAHLRYKVKLLQKRYKIKRLNRNGCAKRP